MVGSLCCEAEWTEHCELTNNIKKKILHHFSAFWPRSSVKNSTAVNTTVPTYLLTAWSLYSDTYLHGEVLGHREALFLIFPRNLHAVLCNGSTNWHSHRTRTRVPFPPQPRQHVPHLVFLVTVILRDMRCCLAVVLICIALMNGDGDTVP